MRLVDGGLECKVCISKEPYRGHHGIRILINGTTLKYRTSISGTFF